jgi:uncharacterized delta-60 repeat protein
MRTFAIVGLLAFAVVVNACGDDEGAASVDPANDPAGNDGGTGSGNDGGTGPGTDGGPNPTSNAAFDLAVASRAVIRAGVPTIVDVTLKRTGSAPAPVTITVKALPAGVTASPLTIAANETTGKLSLQATGALPATGGPIEVDGTSGSLVRSATMKLLFAGAAGTLDGSFGASGTAVIATTGTPSALAVQSDAKILVGGGDADLATITRFSEDGVVDTTYGTAGTVTLPVTGGTKVKFLALAIDSQGRAVAVGQYLNAVTTYNRVVVARFTSAGVLDTTFGTGGTYLPGGFDGAVDPATDRYETPGSILVQPDGKLVYSVGLAGASFLRRLTTAGAPNEGFGTAGVASDIAGGGTMRSRASLLADGTILSTSSTSAVHWSSAGVLDTTFGTGGHAYTGALAVGVAVQPGLGILVVSNGATVGPTTIRRLSMTGILDPTFATAGIFTFGTDNASGAPFVDTTGYVGPRFVIDEKGRIIFTRHENATKKAIAPIRLTAAGALDPDFGTGGIAAATSAAVDFEARDIAFHTEGRLLVVGHTATPSGIQIARFWR